VAVDGRFTQVVKVFSVDVGGVGRSCLNDPVKVTAEESRVTFGAVTATEQSESDAT